jgi:hypothetical protein
MELDWTPVLLVSPSSQRVDSICPSLRRWRTSSLNRIGPALEALVYQKGKGLQMPAAQERTMSIPAGYAQHDDPCRDRGELSRSARFEDASQTSQCRCFLHRGSDPRETISTIGAFRRLRALE